MLLLLLLVLLLSLLEESPAPPSPLRIGYVGCIPLSTGHIGITVGSQKCYTGHEILQTLKERLDFSRYEGVAELLHWLGPSSAINTG